MSMWTTLRGRKRAPDPLKLQLWMVVSHHVGAGDQTQVLWTRRLLTAKAALEAKGTTVTVKRKPMVGEGPSITYNQTAN